MRPGARRHGGLVGRGPGPAVAAARGAHRGDQRRGRAGEAGRLGPARPARRTRRPAAGQRSPPPRRAPSWWSSGIWPKRTCTSTSSARPTTPRRSQTPCSALVASLGGSISSEHGVGRAKARWLDLSRTPGRDRRHALGQGRVRSARPAQPGRPFPGGERTPASLSAAPPPAARATPQPADNIELEGSSRGRDDPRRRRQAREALARPA